MAAFRNILHFSARFFIMGLYILRTREILRMEDIQKITATPAMELPECPVETTLILIGDKWKVLILRDLMSGSKRFGELKKSIGSVSQKVLTTQLRQMEGCGLLTRTVYPEVPPHVEYALTDLGRSLKPVLDAMSAWGSEYKAMNARD